MTVDGEQFVRIYLHALKDPSSLRDGDRIRVVQERLASEDDVLERVKLRQELLEAEQPSIREHEESFVRYSKEWAETTGVGPAAFAAEGVSEETLRRAGFSIGRKRGGRRPAAGPRDRRTRRARVTTEQIRASIPRRKRFTIGELQEATGASQGTLRKVLSEEESAGRLVSQGSDPSHRGPGRNLSSDLGHSFRSSG